MAKEETAVQENNVTETLEMLSKAIKSKSAFVIQNPELKDVVFDYGDFGDLTSKTSKGGFGIAHIIQRRFETEHLSKENIASLLLVIKEIAESEKPDSYDSTHTRAFINKKGIRVVLQSNWMGNKKSWLVSGYGLLDSNQNINSEATETIKAVTAQYGYKPEHAFLCEQVGAVIASIPTIREAQQKVKEQKASIKIEKGIKQISSANPKTVFDKAVLKAFPANCTDKQLISSLAASFYAQNALKNKELSNLYKNTKKKEILESAADEKRISETRQELQSRGYTLRIENTLKETNVLYERIIMPNQLSSVNNSKFIDQNKSIQQKLHKKNITVRNRIDLLRNKTEISEEEIDEIIEFKHEYADMKTLPIYTDKNFREMTVEEKKELVTQLLRDDYLKYKNCHIARSKLLYDTSETLAKEISIVDKLNDLGYEIYLLPYGYARDSMNCYQKSADSISFGNFLEFKTVVSTGKYAGQSVYSDGIKQADNIFISLINETSEEKVINNIYKVINEKKRLNKQNGKTTDFSGLVFLNFEKDNNRTVLYNFDKEGKGLRLDNPTFENLKKCLEDAKDFQVQENPMTEHSSSPIKNISQYENLSTKQQSEEKNMAEEKLKKFSAKDKEKKYKEQQKLLAELNKLREKNEELEFYVKNFASIDFPKINLSEASDWLVENERKAGVDIKGFKHQVAKNFIYHALNKHGNEKSEKLRGNVAITTDDITNLKEIFENPDIVAFGLKRNGEDLIAYTKKLPDGTSVYFEEILSGKKNKALRSKTLYKKVGEISKEKFKRIISSNPHNDCSKMNIALGEEAKPSVLRSQTNGIGSQVRNPTGYESNISQYENLSTKQQSEEKNMAEQSTIKGFTDDAKKMEDFNELTKKEFLESHSDVKENEYDATVKELKEKGEYTLPWNTIKEIAGTGGKAFADEVQYQRELHQDDDYTNDADGNFMRKFDAMYFAAEQNLSHRGLDMDTYRDLFGDISEETATELEDEKRDILGSEVVDGFIKGIDDFTDITDIQQAYDRALLENKTYQKYAPIELNRAVEIADNLTVNSMSDFLYSGMQHYLEPATLNKETAKFYENTLSEALFTAETEINTEAFKTLLENGADITYRKTETINGIEHKANILHYIAADDNTEALSLLMDDTLSGKPFDHLTTEEKQSLLSEKNFEGRTPLEVSENYYREEPSRYEPDMIMPDVMKTLAHKEEDLMKTVPPLILKDKLTGNTLMVEQNTDKGYEINLYDKNLKLIDHDISGGYINDLGEFVDYESTLEAARMRVSMAEYEEKGLWGNFYEYEKIPASEKQIEKLISSADDSLTTNAAKRFDAVIDTLQEKYSPKQIQKLIRLEQARLMTKMDRVDVFNYFNVHKPDGNYKGGFAVPDAVLSMLKNDGGHLEYNKESDKIYKVPDETKFTSFAALEEIEEVTPKQLIDEEKGRRTVTHSVTFPAHFIMAEKKSLSLLENLQNKYGFGENDFEEFVNDGDVDIHFAAPVPKEYQFPKAKTDEWIKSVCKDLEENFGAEDVAAGMDGSERVEKIFNTEEEARKFVEEKPELKIYHILKESDVKDLEIVSDEDFSDIVDSIILNDYKHIPNVIRLPNLNEKLSEKLGLDKNAAFLMKKSATHIRPDRKGSYDQAFDTEEYREIPKVMRNADFALVDKREKNFQIVFDDKNDLKKINKIVFNKDELGNYLVTIGKVDRRDSISETNNIVVGVGVAPTISALRFPEEQPATRLRPSPTTITGSIALHVEKSSEPASSVDSIFNNFIKKANSEYKELKLIYQAAAKALKSTPPEQRKIIDAELLKRGAKSPEKLALIMQDAFIKLDKPEEYKSRNSRTDNYGHER